MIRFLRSLPQRSLYALMALILLIPGGSGSRLPTSAFTLPMFGLTRIAFREYSTETSSRIP